MTQLITPPQSFTYRHVLPPSPPSHSPLTVLLPCSPSQSSPDRRVLPPAQPGGLLRPPVARQPGGSRGGGTTGNCMTERAETENENENSKIII